MGEDFGDFMDKVIVGLSGGVDSSVAAMLLKKKGYEVIGVTMVQFEEPSFLDDARLVAEHLGMRHRVIDMRDDFKRDIMDYFVSEYSRGFTPNPCSFCNPLIKWKSLMKVMEEEGAQFVATGHYARIEKENERYSIKNSVTALKDQTYALAFLTQEQLSHTLMPLGDYTKEEVREMAVKAGIPVAGKADSQDICFIPDGDYGKFLKDYGNINLKLGNFVDKYGKVLGTHKGIENYTIGQRKGLNLVMGHPVFVTEIKSSTGEVVIGENEDLFKTECVIEKINYMKETAESMDLGREYIGKVRYAHPGTKCIVKIDDTGRLLVKFKDPVRAITPGQSFVLYDGELVVLGGVITC